MHIIQKAFRLVHLEISKLYTGCKVERAKHEIDAFKTRNHVITFDHPNEAQGTLTPPSEKEIEDCTKESMAQLTFYATAATGPSDTIITSSHLYINTPENSFPPRSGEHGLLISRFRAYAGLIANQTREEAKLKEIDRKIQLTKEGKDYETTFLAEAPVNDLMFPSLSKKKKSKCTFARLMKQYGLK